MFVFSGRKKMPKNATIKERDIYCLSACVCVCAVQTPKLEAAKRSEADTLVEAVVWA